MYSYFYEDLNTYLYPSRLLHSYGVNGKISGSIGAIGEMSGNVIAVLHSPIGCGFHYRFSARRRHQPYFPLISTDMTEEDIIFGGEKKLLETVRRANHDYHPSLIMVIPSPVTDILNEDICSAVKKLRAEGIPAVSIQSELFSHRDKNYSKNRLKELAKMKISGNNQLEMELKGCGFTEALYALVDQVMEPHEKCRGAINIETIGWGGEGSLMLREIEEFLKPCGISINCWIPSADISKLKEAPKAELNLVKRIRWARYMKNKFGTDYLHISDSGRYIGLDGICRFYLDIGEKLQMFSKMEVYVENARLETLKIVEPIKTQLSHYECVIICRGLQMAPFVLKKYAHEFGLNIRAICIILSDDTRRNMDITEKLEQDLVARIQEAADLYSANTTIHVNPTPKEINSLLTGADAIVGTDDFTLEKWGLPVIPEMPNTISLSFQSYIRNLKRMERRLKNRSNKKDLILNCMPFSAEHFPRHEDSNSLAAREMWEKMWLKREEDNR